MGRGRAKAKQTKVARDLKYSTTDFDPQALARELHGSESSAGAVESEEYDDYGDWANPNK